MKAQHPIAAEAATLGLLAFVHGKGWTVVENTAGGPARGDTPNRSLGKGLTDDDARGLLYGYSAMLEGRCSGSFCTSCRE